MKKSNAIAAIAICTAASVLLFGGILLFTVRNIISAVDEPTVEETPVTIVPESPPPSPESDTEVFERLIDGLFADWVSSDTITMNFFLADPKAMGIERPAPTYGEVTTPELIAKERGETARIDSILLSVDRSELDAEYQVIYDIVSRNIELSKIMEAKDDYSYYTGFIKPTIGIQVQLPVLLAEFKFYTARDIEDYLSLLGDTVRYFDDIIAFERERAARGYFLNESHVDEIIGQLESFLEDREDNFLITLFDDRIDEYPGLTDEQREEYKQQNREQILGNVLVAYENLLDAMRSLKGTGTAPGGLALLPDGERVALAMVSLSAGTDRSAEDLEAIVNVRRMQALFNIRSILVSDDEIMEKYMNSETGQIPPGTPDEYLAVLQEAIKEEFPAISATGHTVYEVHESLRDFMSPAFYLMPAVDSFDENVIYVNPTYFADTAGDNLSLFTVLAHEGYPGHLYDTVYSRQKAPHPIRTMLSNTGHTEGWATYAEQWSYDYAGLDPLEALFMSELNLYFLLLQSHIDIGVNLLGWDEEDIALLLFEDLGIEDEETVTSYYDSVTGIPLNISMYALGYLEIEMLRAQAEAEKGPQFSLYDFHKFMLDFGPAPFEMIRSSLGN